MADIKAQMILLKADLPGLFYVHVIAMNTLISTLPSWPYIVYILIISF